MKTLSPALLRITLVFLLFYSKPTNAQINNICDAFGGLMNESKTAFNNIAGGRIESGKGIRLASTFCIDGAVSWPVVRSVPQDKSNLTMKKAVCDRGVLSCR